MKGAHKSANCKAIELRFDRRKNQHCAFTMAEILLSLTIIGVVAAITLPSLTGNINERTWNTQRKALYARFSQGLALMPSLGGYGTYQLADEATSTSAVDTAAETFVTEGLSKVIKINNICDHEHLEDCGIVTSYTNLAGSMNSWPTKLSELNIVFTSSYGNGSAAGGENYQNPQKDIDTFAAAFETQNGESVAVYYNPNCQSDMEETGWHYSQPKMCANFIYDLNGNKGPNTVGKDIGFISALYSSDPVVVAPVPLTRNVSGQKKQTEAGEACTSMDAESRLPNIDELSSMFYNKDLIGIPSGDFWSGSVVSSGESGTALHLVSHTGVRGPDPKTYPLNVRCIKR